MKKEYSLPDIEYFRTITKIMIDKTYRKTENRSNSKDKIIVLMTLLDILRMFENHCIEHKLDWMNDFINNENCIKQTDKNTFDIAEYLVYNEYKNDFIKEFDPLSYLSLDEFQLNKPIAFYMKNFYIQLLLYYTEMICRVRLYETDEFYSIKIENMNDKPKMRIVIGDFTEINIELMIPAQVVNIRMGFNLMLEQLYELSCVLQPEHLLS